MGEKGKGRGRGRRDGGVRKEIRKKIGEGSSRKESNNISLTKSSTLLNILNALTYVILTTM